MGTASPSRARVVWASPLLAVSILRSCFGRAHRASHRQHAGHDADDEPAQLAVSGGMLAPYGGWRRPRLRWRLATDAPKSLDIDRHQIESNGAAEILVRAASLLASALDRTSPELDAHAPALDKSFATSEAADGSVRAVGAERSESRAD